MRMWAIVPAAGIGRRFKSMIPKQYLNICGAPVLRHSLNCLLKFEEFVKIIVVLHPEDKYWGDLDIDSSRIETVIGGDERAEASEWKGRRRRTQGRRACRRSACGRGLGARPLTCTARPGAAESRRLRRHPGKKCRSP